MRIVARVFVVLLVLLGVLFAVAGTAPLILGRIAMAQAASADPATRKRGLSYLRDERDARGLAVIVECLAREEDPALVELAGYTAMRTRDPRAIAPLQARADRESDSPLRAKLILYAARVADGDYRVQPWLEEGLRSEEIWRRVGSAAGLLQVGRVEGGSALLDLAATLPDEAGAFALTELRRVAEVMAQTVGYPLPAEGADDGDTILSLREFWERHAHPRLLCDALARLDRSDPDWHEVDRLLHARQRVARWVN